MITTVAEMVGAFIALAAVVVAAWSVWQNSRDNKLQLQVTNLREYSKLYFELFTGKAKILSSPPNNHYKEELKEFLDRYFGMCYQEYFLANQGLLHDSVWNSWKEKIKKNVNKELFRNEWKEIDKKEHFSKDYTQFINSLIKNNGS